MKNKTRNRLLFIGGAVVLAAVIFLSVVFGGFINVGVQSGHPAAVEWVLRTTMENSVQNHAEDIEVPDTLNLDDVKFYRQFYGHYSAACQTCHAAPGVPADPWMVIYPEAPDLTKPETVQKWSTEELFWIIKNGIKDTGMMALGPTHPEKAVWGVTAFVEALPEMSPEEYQAIAEWYKEMQAKKKEMDM